MSTRVARDEHGRVVGFPHHDGFIEGILTRRGMVQLAIRDTSGESRVITLRGVSGLHVSGFRQGNIILCMHLLTTLQAAADSELCKLLADQMRAVPLLEPSAWVFVVDASYGADLVAVCTDVEVSEPGLSLIVG